MHTLRVRHFYAMLQGVIAPSLQHPAKLNTYDECTLCLAAIVRRHPFVAHGQPHLCLSGMKVRWKVHLGGDTLRLRTLLAGRTNTKISICLRVQDCLWVRDQKNLQCLNTIGTLQALIKVKEQRAETTRCAILHPLLEYFIRT